MVSSGLIAGLSPRASAEASTSIGILFKENARCSAATLAPGERKITAIFDHGKPSRKCAVRKACAM